jgi:hypothetical protein
MTAPLVTLQVSGGANFYAKVDNGIVVHRDWSRAKELQVHGGWAVAPAKQLSNELHVST